MDALERRHLATLTFAEVRRALQALSSLYVERRGRLATGAALEGAGKRAAFALYYGPLHFLLVREIVRALGGGLPPRSRVLDLGCGTGAAGAAWALEADDRPFVEGVDRSGWAVEEARFTLARLGLRGEARKGALERARIPDPPGGVVAAFAVNEVPEDTRPGLLEGLVAAARRGTAVLVVEPLARRALPWWDGWASAFAAAGGRADEWRFAVPLPDVVARLDRAAGLDHRELGGRSLWLPTGR
jgi:SAM-dependent methyltransferase